MLTLFKIFINSLKITYYDFIFMYKAQKIFKQLMNIKIPIRSTLYNKRTKAIVIVSVDYGRNSVLIHRIKTNNIDSMYKYNPLKQHSESVFTLKEIYRILFDYYIEGNPKLRMSNLIDLRIIDLQIENLYKANSKMRFVDTSRFYKN